MIFSFESESKANHISYSYEIGGYFGAGWFRDLWRIPEYVKDANNDPSYLSLLSNKMREMPRPPIKVNYLIDKVLYLFFMDHIP